MVKGRGASPIAYLPPHCFAPTIAGVNGLQISTDADVARLVSIAFENLHLLRLERRLFISYRRAESTDVAIQLFEALDERGFDVFFGHKECASRR